MADGGLAPAIRSASSAIRPPISSTLRRQLGLHLAPARRAPQRRGNRRPDGGTRATDGGRQPAIRHARLL